MDRAVVLVSGGINSTVAAAIAKEQYEPALLHVAWGHRSAERELAAFESIADVLHITKTSVAELSCMAFFGGNARVSRRLSVEDASALSQTETPSTFALGLIPSMLSLAATWAASLNAKRIIIGLSEDHGVPGPKISDLYPDYRHEFLQIFNLMLDYAKPTNRELVVEAPLIDLTRAEVIQLGNRLKIPFEKTWSCYRKTDQPCGRCWSCVTRAAGFVHANAPDPLMLESVRA